MSIACSDKYGTGDDRKEHTEWVRLIFWQKLAEIVGQYVHKGDLMFVSGRLATRKWQDKDGNERQATEIIASTMKMLGTKSGNNSSNDADDISGDDVPF